ncbi:RNA polymerase sigma factor [Paenibacillus soyae]|uniref:RNA polymerase sigma factor n=1 Tax=Paenibacillus soyae TaxID=2969249 RepID=A0A9X2MSS3_9BACL|nr:RNA polymerase sigma factor [Paenibacillus soyae]
MDVNGPLDPLSREQIEEFVKDVQAGHVEPYRAIVQHYQRRLHIYCYYMLGNQAESEDAVQEVFLKAYRGIGKYRPTVSFTAWLYKIAQRHCLNVLRQNSGQQRLVSLLKLQWPSPPPPRMVESANRLLNGLSAEERQLVILRVIEEYSFLEIEEITGVGAATLRKKFERIRKKLNQKPNREVIIGDGKKVYSEL